MKLVSMVALLLIGAAAQAEFSGRIRLEEDSFVDTQPTDVHRSEESALIQFELHEKLGDSWRLRIEPNARLSSVPRITDSFDGDLRDTNLEYKSDWIRLQAGSFIKVWEGPDGLNPMDIASVRNYRDPFSGETIGSVGLAASGPIGENFSWDAIYVPWQTPVRLPGANSPWWPRSSSQSVFMAGTQFLGSDSTEFQIDHHDARGDALLNNWGARAQFHFENIDLSGAFFSGASQVPVLAIQEISGNLLQSAPYQIIQLSGIEFRPIEYRRRTAAAGATWTAHSWIFRLAGRYDQPVDGDLFLPGWSDQFVGSVEKTTSIGSQTVILSLAYAYENGAHQGEFIVNTADPFRRAILAGARIPFTDDLVLFVSGLYDVKNSAIYKDRAQIASYAHVNLHRKLGSHWAVDGSFDWINGAQDSLLGLWSHEGRVFLAGQYQF